MADGRLRVSLDYARWLLVALFRPQGAASWGDGAFPEAYRAMFPHRNYLLSQYVSCCAQSRHQNSTALCETVLEEYSPGRNHCGQIIGPASDIVLQAAKEKLLGELPSETLDNIRSYTPPGGFHFSPSLIAADVVSARADRKGPMRFQHGTRGRIAVITSGIVERFYPISTFRHVIQPAVRAGYQVDYHVVLDWGSRPAGSRLLAFKDSNLNARLVANPGFANASKQDIGNYLVRLGRQYGASTVQALFLDPGIEEDRHPYSSRRYVGHGTRASINFRTSLLHLLVFP